MLWYPPGESGLPAQLSPGRSTPSIWINTVSVWGWWAAARTQLNALRERRVLISVFGHDSKILTLEIVVFDCTPSLVLGLYRPDWRRENDGYYTSRPTSRPRPRPRRRVRPCRGSARRSRRLCARRTSASTARKPLRRMRALRRARRA